MMNMRTRLAPGRGWVYSPRPPEGDIRYGASGSAPAPSPQAPAPRPAANAPVEPRPTGPEIPGVDITEHDSDTLFDKLFGPTTIEPHPTQF